MASDQVVAGSNPAAPIILRDGQHLADGSTSFIKEPLFGRFDFITLRDGGRRYHAIRQHLIDSLGTKYYGREEMRPVFAREIRPNIVGSSSDDDRPLMFRFSQCGVHLFKGFKRGLQLLSNLCQVRFCLFVGRSSFYVVDADPIR